MIIKTLWNVFYENNMKIYLENYMLGLLAVYGQQSQSQSQALIILMGPPSTASVSLQTNGVPARCPQYFVLCSSVEHCYTVTLFYSQAATTALADSSSSGVTQKYLISLLDLFHIFN